MCKYSPFLRNEISHIADLKFLPKTLTVRSRENRCYVLNSVLVKINVLDRLEFQCYIDNHFMFDELCEDTKTENTGSISIPMTYHWQLRTESECIFMLLEATYYLYVIYIRRDFMRIVHS